MGSKGGPTPGPGGGIVAHAKPCHLMLRHCLAVHLRKEGSQGDPGEFWMYDSGYLLFQGLLAANSVCWWNTALCGAARGLRYRGYVAPGALLITAEPCALEIVRGAWSRRVLKPPAGYIIVGLGDIEDCLVTTIPQGHFTPLPEAVCEVVLQLTTQGRPAGLDAVRRRLLESFPHMQPPAERVLYDTLAQLTAERKVYQTSRGYFIVTPERRRSRSHSRGRRRGATDDSGIPGISNGIGSRGMLMSTEEALVLVHGEMATIRDGEVTHQCIQTNLADVICGGNASDKILYPRSNKRRSASFPAPRSLERRGSFRLWGSNRRLRRSASTRTIAKTCSNASNGNALTDSSSSTEYPAGSDSPTASPKKESLLSRIFRRSKRSHCRIKTFSAQFPPAEWFNSRAIHLHSIGTQTTTGDKQQPESTTNNTIPYYYDNSELSSARSATLPRRHRRQPSNESACATSFADSREPSPSLRHRSPSSTLPRSTNLLKVPRGSARFSESNSRKTSRSSLSTTKNVSSNLDFQLNEAKSSTVEAANESLKASQNSLPLQKDIRDISKIEDGIIPADSNYIIDNFSSHLTNGNSGPSSIESQSTSTKTLSSQNTAGSGPSSLESHRTVISQRQNSGPSSLDSQSTITDYKANRKSSPKNSPKRREAKYSPKVVTTTPTTSTPIKTKMSHSNSFTLQVTTNQNGVNYSSPNGTNATTTATINSGAGGNTKIYVQNSPVRSVITFENGQSDPNVVIINGAETTNNPVTETAKVTTQTTCSNIINSNSSTNTTSTVTDPLEKSNFETPDMRKYQKNCNTAQTQNYDETNLNKVKDFVLVDDKNETMNNSRKLSLQLTPTPRDGLSYKNVLKNVPSSSCNSNPGSPIINGFRDFTKNSFASNPPSPTKSFDNLGGSVGNMYYDKYLADSKSALEKSYDNGLQSSTISISNNKIVEKNTLGSEPNLSCKIPDSFNKTLTRENSRDYQFPSLSDLSFNFTSLTAQKILKGVSINSIDTLVELNMAANGDKPNNCDVVHTDFGLV